MQTVSSFGQSSLGAFTVTGLATAVAQELGQIEASIQEVRKLPWERVLQEK